MKNLIKFIMVSVLFISCDNWIDENINIDPNNPDKVPVNLLLPSAQAGISYSAGGELSRYTGYWMQYIAGVNTHALRHEIYGTNEADVDNLWKYYTYGGTLADLNKIIAISSKDGNNHYLGIAKVLMAYKLGVTTDMWGDVPYKDAFRGDEGKIVAKYDKQEDIYKTLFTLLDEAISNLDSKSINSPGSDDLIYGGDLKKWKKAAYALKARFNIHLSKVKGNEAYLASLQAISKAFSANSDDLEFAFGEAKSENAPLFQYVDQRGGYIGGIADYLMNILKNEGDVDPRLAIYAKPNKEGNYEGILPGAISAEGKSFIGDYFTKSDARVSLMTYAELKFIEAEANFSKSSPDKKAAAKAYNEAVKTSLLKYNVSNPEWEKRNASETDATITLDKIMKGKYIALFLQDEIFSDWRRHTNVFGFKLAKGAKTSELPRRLPYPQSEREYNIDNMPKGVKITDRIWWDKN